MNLLDMPLGRRHYKIIAVSSMEQLIGAGLSTVVGVIIPMLALLHHGGMSSVMQGLLGASGLIGIAIGAPIIGNMSDRQGYLWWFRACPAIIAAASVLVWLTSSVWVIFIGLFLMGFGVGGGYTLDSDYISELMPSKWSLMMVGVAKATSSIGFFAVAGVCWIILKCFPEATVWRWLILVVGALGLVTFVMRLRWWESPRWLLTKGRTAEAQTTVKDFLGPDATITPLPAAKTSESVSLLEMFRGENLKKVILTGIPWACEGVGVYGVGVFMPMLVMALGIDKDTSTGMAKIINSVELTTVINFFIVPGFVVGLLLVRRLWHIGMLTGGFVISALSLALLLATYLLHWPVWMAIAFFAIFEVALNAGPHLITFILPTQVYPVGVRGTGSGIASFFGKAGAILGVFFMPMLLRWGGITLVLAVCIAVNVIGAAITWAYRSLTPRESDTQV